jgi:hypothetical protein
LRYRSDRRWKKVEGVGVGYERIDDLLVRVQEGGETMRATTYIAMVFERTLQPYDWHRALVITGAQLRRLPAAWIAMLEQVASVPDPEAKRIGRLEAPEVLRQSAYRQLVKP